MKTALKVLSITLFALAFLGAVYGAYWLAKTLSYKWWYQDMVRATVQEMVKPEALK